MCANLIHSKKMKAESRRLISQTCSKDTALNTSLHSNANQILYVHA